VRLPIGANKRKKQASKVVGGVEDSDVVSVAQPVTTRRGRKVKVPNNLSSTNHLDIVKECSVSKNNDNIH
jgi:hypothetical protein